MENGNQLQNAIDNARLTTRLAVISSGFSLVLLVATLIINAYRGGDVFALAAIPFAFALLFSLTALIYGMLRSAAELENEEKALLAQRVEARALNVEEDVRFTAGRSFENYRRFAPYAITVIAAVLMGILLVRTHLFWSGREAATVGMKGNSIHTALISAVMAVISIFVGAFFAGQSRTKSFRWLRPVGAWMIAGFAVMAGATVASICYGNNLTTLDGVLAKVFFWIFAVLGAEFIINFIIEFYRPRTLQEARPVFESQILSLFTEPGGVMRNIALALDYQFGFKVSGTWLYAFIERSFFPVLIVWALIFWGFTMIHEVGPNQVGVRECLGKVTSEKLLEPGIYWTLPTPFGKIRRFSCTELKRLVVGETTDGAQKRAAAPVVLWTNQHGGPDDHFLVAVPPAPGKNNDSEVASISFVRMAIPITYRIKRDGVMDYGYKNADPVNTLKLLGQQAVSEFLASSSMMELMSSGRSAAEQAMKERVQKLADNHSLGIEIVTVCILDAHPPVEKVAPAYQDVIGAMEQKETEILNAKAYEAKLVPETQAEVLALVADAESSAYTASKVAAAESERFSTQLKTYKIMPSMFKIKAYLDFFETECADIRKFVVSSDLDTEVYQFNFESKERLDLIDVDPTKLSNK